MDLPKLEAALDNEQFTYSIKASVFQVPGRVWFFGRSFCLSRWLKDLPKVQTEGCRRRVSDDLGDVKVAEEFPSAV